MSASWNEGYFTDTDYLWGYYPNLNPTLQQFYLLLSGIEPLTPTAESAHCELGYGQGLSANIHALATAGRFVGTDFTPSQAANAQKIAHISGNGALLLDDSFEQLLHRSDIPMLDSISLHGIWSWVNPQNRGFILEFARRYLKPGGVFHISYNSLPGWSPYTPIRYMLSLHDRYRAYMPATEAKVPDGASAAEALALRHSQRMEDTLEFARSVLKLNPPLRRNAPLIAGRVDELLKKNRDYIAHEYLNQSWHPRYFADVAEELASGADLQWVSTMPSLEGIWLQAGLSDNGGWSFLEEITHPVLREQVLDVFLQRQFRMDCFVRTPRKLTPQQQRQRLLAQPLVLTQPLEVARKHLAEHLRDTLHGKIDPKVFDPLLTHLAAREYAPKPPVADPASIASDADLATLVDHLRILLLAKELIAPAQSGSSTEAVRERCKSFNRWLNAQSLVSKDFHWQASPVTGGGVRMSTMEQAMLHFMRQGYTSAKQLGRRMYDYLLSQQQMAVRDDGSMPRNMQESFEICQTRARHLIKRLPLLRALQTL